MRHIDRDADLRIDAAAPPISVEEIASSNSLAPEQVEKVLTLLQTFDPIGVCARDLRECLLIQARHYDAADEILLSSATKEILPVTSLDGDAVGHGALRGKPGPVYARLYEAYQRAKQTQSI